MIKSRSWQNIHILTQCNKIKMRTVIAYWNHTKCMYKYQKGGGDAVARYPTERVQAQCKSITGTEPSSLIIEQLHHMQKIDHHFAIS
jgi:hypothetical protein